VEGLRSRRWRVTVVELDPVPHPLQPPLDTAAAQFASIPDHTLVLVDGLAFGTMPELVERHGCRLRFVPIVHMTLSTTSGLLPGELGWLSNLERRALEHARHVIVTGRPTLPLISALSRRLQPDDISFIPPGTDRRQIPRAPSAGSHSLRLLCVANITPGKGHDVLLRALARVRDVPWRLVCAGSVTRDPAYAAHVSALARELRIDDRLTLAGEMSEGKLEAEYSRSDLFVLATRRETYGMAVAEAIAHGVPVVSTRTGEIPDIVGAGGGLAEPDDEEQFAGALAAVMSSRDVLARMAEGAKAAARLLPTWDDAAARMAGVLDNVAP
jgi:glycosyltransferase involved in cell wall biosynthesis